MNHKDMIRRITWVLHSNVFCLSSYASLRLRNPDVLPPTQTKSKFKTDKQRVRDQQKKFTF